MLARCPSLLTAPCGVPTALALCGLLGCPCPPAAQLGFHYRELLWLHIWRHRGLWSALLPPRGDPTESNGAPLRQHDTRLQGTALCLAMGLHLGTGGASPVQPLGPLFVRDFVCSYLAPPAAIVVLSGAASIEIRGPLGLKVTKRLAYVLRCDPGLHSGLLIAPVGRDASELAEQCCYILNTAAEACQLVLSDSLHDIAGLAKEVSQKLLAEQSIDMHLCEFTLQITEQDGHVWLECLTDNKELWHKWWLFKDEAGIRVCKGKSIVSVPGSRGGQLVDHALSGNQ
eukprot:m51a1_g12481 hypothetical protein (285) ;mRNA; r:3026-4444